MKQITEQQAAAIAQGDIIKRYPYNGAPEALFDERRTNYIETYEVGSVNKTTGVVELVTAADTVSILLMPGEVSRVFISPGDLVSQKTWWVSDVVVSPKRL